MTRAQIFRDFFKMTILPIAVVTLFYCIFRSVCVRVDGSLDWPMLWLITGIPFGIRKMCVWLVPHNYDIAGSVGILLVNVLVGGLIGGIVLVWRLICAVAYVFITVYRLVTSHHSIQTI